MSTNLPISKELQDTIIANAAAQTNFSKDQIALTVIAAWDNKGCYIIKAQPNAFDYQPLSYAIINGEVLEATQKENYGKIIKACFPNLTQEDPVTIARLSVMFAHFDLPVGIVWQRNLNIDHPEISTPTNDFNPIFKKEGAATVLEFYTFSAPLSTFYFCQVIFNGNEPVLKATELN